MRFERPWLTHFWRARDGGGGAADAGEVPVSSTRATVYNSPRDARSVAASRSRQRAFRPGTVLPGGTAGARVRGGGPAAARPRAGDRGPAVRASHRSLG